jgi:hypothetical protein
MTTARTMIHLAAHFPGVNNTTVWSDPRSGSHIDFSSFAPLAQAVVADGDTSTFVSRPDVGAFGVNDDFFDATGPADTDADAEELAGVVRDQQVSGQTAIRFLEQLWNRDLSSYDYEGTTLREHLGLAPLDRPGAQERVA